jgi:putative tricarboxylic transport membrane protein
VSLASPALSDAQRDRLLAVAALVFAGSLIAGARALEDSLLSDAVGAGGVPQGVGIAMGLAAVALFAKSFFGGPKARAAAQARAVSGPAAKAADGKGGANAVNAGHASHAGDAGEAGEAGEAMGWTAAARTAGLVAILVAYGLLLPWLGYPLTVSLLVLASGWLAGAALKPPLFLCALASGPLLWAMFDWALRVRMPVGSLWS